jgi:hypothetical protein
MAEYTNFLWPYDEVQITQNEKGVNFKAPWVSVSFPQKIADPVFERLLEIRASGPQNKDEVLLMDSLMRPVKKYPIYFFLPKPQRPVDAHLKGYSFQSAESIRWNMEPMFTLGQVQPGFYDVVSVLSYCRLFHLLDLNRYLATVSRDIQLQDMSGESLRAATLLFLRQNHYVTQRCEEVLTPAVGLHPSSSNKVKEFIREEQGHDKLLALSFKELGVAEESIPVLPSLVAVMDFFAEIASTNLLGFCFVVDMFERSPEAGRNPIVQALTKLGELKAAKPIQAHSNINVHGGHDNESVEILDTLGAVPEAYVVEGVLLAQKASDLMIAFHKERNASLQAFKQN